MFRLRLSLSPPVSLSFLEFLVRIRLQIIAGGMLHGSQEAGGENKVCSTLQRKLLLGSTNKAASSQDGDDSSGSGDPPPSSCHDSESGLSDAAQQSFLRGRSSAGLHCWLFSFPTPRSLFPT